MKIADLVHHIGWEPENLGIVIGFDEEGDPQVKWIVPCNGEITYEYLESLIIIEDKNEI